MRLTAERLLTSAGWLEPGMIEIDGGVITAVRPARGRGEWPVIAPGFVDLQVNGAGAVDVAGADADGWTELERGRLAQGVTAWCPTLISRPLVDYPPILARLARLAERGGTGRAGSRPRPRVAGVHLEGPFLGGAPGAHDPRWIRPPDLPFLTSLPPLVRIVTLGPEQPGALAAIRLLVARGVLVSLGHTAADAARIGAAVTAGARLATHLFNAMPTFHHRHPGVAGAVLNDDRVAASLIADGHHLAADAVRLAWRAKGPDRIALVTDSVAWRRGSLGEREVRLDGGAPRLADGTLAGSDLTMVGAVRWLVDRVGLEAAEVLGAASRVPADLLGRADLGRIEAGARADLVALDGTLGVEGVWIGGRPAL